MRHSRVVAAIIAVLVALGGGVTAHADTTYTVRPGDGLRIIARRNRVALAALLDANHLTIDSMIHPGQVLVIPGGTADPTTYEVRRGDGLRAIARANGVSLVALLQANGLRADSTIHPGQVLAIPPGGVSPVPAPGPTTPPAATNTGSLPAQVRAHADLVPVFQAVAGETGMAVDLLMAIGYHESRWNAAAVSSAGALGVCQVMPATAAWVARDLVGEPDLDPRSAAGGIRIGAYLLKWLVQQAGGDLDRALAMYAQGVGGVQRAGISASSRRFIDEIAGLRPQFA
jgi:LysM repeat protein